MGAHNPYAPPKAIVDAGTGVADIDSLPVSDSWKRRFNVLAFLFGPFYYFFKGSYARATGFAAAAVYGTLANRDYYAKMVLGQNGWWWRAS